MSTGENDEGYDSDGDAVIVVSYIYLCTVMYYLYIIGDFLLYILHYVPIFCSSLQWIHPINI